MKVNIYYGGRGVLDDPTIYVITRLEEALSELRVEVKRYNIFENRNQISTLPKTLNDADGVIFATTVEWLGIGGYMNQFLDSCWLYGDKEKIASLYMMPVVISTTYGEREGVLTLENAWEILGGLLCSGLCGYVENIANFENNREYKQIIGQKAENLYRTINQKRKGLPASNQAIARSVLRTQQLDLTPQESEQLSVYVSDERKVEKQKEDITELSSLYRGILQNSDEVAPSTELVSIFKSMFVPEQGFAAKYSIELDTFGKPLFIDINEDKISCKYENHEDADVTLKISRVILDEIMAGRMTFQKAFTLGNITARGNFSNIVKLDSIFPFYRG
ncbi:MAG: SCP2 sterol-binding domain-containing protein [Lachnospiraceae bacterium]|nr:SCP2 sterol-binding domain-containing protein [Lachnospiraceae bacterium]